MASSHGCGRVWRPSPHSHTQTHHYHHHHHKEAHSNTTPFHHCPHCPLHRPHCPHCPLHTHNSHRNFQPLPPSVPPLPQNPHLFVPLPLPTSVAVQYKEPNSSDPQISQELEHVELDDEEEDDEPVFVLTDEWREFFAKSEARRKLEKKQRKKGKK